MNIPIQRIHSFLLEFFSIIWGIVRFVLIGFALCWVILFSSIILFGGNPFSISNLLWLILGFGWVWAWGEILHGFRWTKFVIFLFGWLVWHIALYMAFLLDGDFFDVDRCYDWGGYWEDVTCVGSELWDKVEARKAAE